MISYRTTWPVFRLFDPETAHHLALRALALGLVSVPKEPEDPILASRLWGLDFPNPVGLGAGFDKHAEVMDAALALGFGFVEAGTVTPRPQSGNPRPRLFRLDEDEAVINRFGFNSQGLAAFAERLARRRNRGGSRGIAGANIGKNRDATDATADYVQCVERLSPLADYLVVNISSPNTPGLRALQSRSQIEGLLERLLAARARVMRDAPGRPPMLVKLAPDLEETELRDIAEVALALGIDGLIVANTTVDRPASLRSRHRGEAGGLSGRPVFEKNNACLSMLYQATGGRLPLIGAGGISSGADAYAKIRLGASLVQVYSALVFHGPELVGRIKRDLAAALRADGYSHLSEAVGAAHRQSPPAGRSAAG
jgi:dihydroorotate dehydrogenase